MNNINNKMLNNLIKYNNYYRMLNNLIKFNNCYKMLNRLLIKIYINKKAAVNRI